MPDKKLAPAMGTREPLQNGNVDGNSIHERSTSGNSLTLPPMDTVTAAELEKYKIEATRDAIRMEYDRDGKIPGRYAIIFEIAERDPELKNLCSVNVLTARITPDLNRFNTLGEAEIFVKMFYSSIYRCELSQGKAKDVIQFIASKNACNPLLDYFNSLPEPHGDPLSDFLEFIKCDNDEAITREIFDLFFKKAFLSVIAADRRILFVNDCVPIFEGGQGIGKTTLVRGIAGNENFYGELGAVGGDLNNKDTLMALGGRLIIEISELEGMRRAEAGALKAFLSKDFDRFRPPYGRGEIDIPRVASFIGTTNEATYLVDPTGARRYYPLKITYIDKNIILRPDIIQNLHSQYYRLALSIMDGENGNAAMYAACQESEALTTYLAEIRPAKSRASLFDDEIERYIDGAESGVITGCKHDDMILLSASDAAIKIFGDLARVPATFPKAFAMIAGNRGYTNAGKKSVFNPATGQTERKRVWEKCSVHMPTCPGCSKQNNETERGRDSAIDKKYFPADPGTRAPGQAQPKKEELDIF